MRNQTRDFYKVWYTIIKHLSVIQPMHLFKFIPCSIQFNFLLSIEKPLNSEMPDCRVIFKLTWLMVSPKCWHLTDRQHRLFWLTEMRKSLRYGQFHERNQWNFEKIFSQRNLMTFLWEEWEILSIMQLKMIPETEGHRQTKNIIPSKNISIWIQWFGSCLRGALEVLIAKNYIT